VRQEIGIGDLVVAAVGRRSAIKPLLNYAPAVFQRVLADFFAISLHFCSGSAAARDPPPFALPSCLRLAAAESFALLFGCRGPILDLPCRDVPN